MRKAPVRHGGITSGARFRTRIASGWWRSLLIGLAVVAVLASGATVAPSAAAASAPGAPTGLTATRGNAQVSLAWTAPSSNGGAAITDYRVQYKLNSASTWTTFNDGTSTARSATVTGLTNGSPYNFRVAAINSVGVGAYSTTASATPSTTPAAPTGVTAAAGNAQLTVSWTTPSTTGGAAITDYAVQYKLTSGSTWTTFTEAVSTATSAIVTGLTNGTGYDARVAAVNAAGTGAWSQAASGTPRTTPTAPTAVSASAGNGQIGLSWSAPASTGGAAITDYQVQYKPTTGSTWTTVDDGVSTMTTATVTGLANGISYDVRMAAVNVAGTGAAAASAATPRTTPAAPTAFTVTAGAQQITLSWTGPTDTGGAAVADYQVQFKPASDSTWTTLSRGASTDTTATITSLSNGTSYDVRVAAINEAGAGPWSATASATPRTAPDAPTDLTAIPGNGQLAVSWSAPAGTGGAAVTGYQVQYKPTTGGMWTTVADGVSTESTATISALINGAGYDVRVAAINEAGTGSWSATVSATPHTTPAAPVEVSLTAGDGQLGLTWTVPSDDGGHAITDYRVRYKRAADTEWSTFADGVSATTSATITDLANGVSYDVRVAAVNAAGVGADSSAATGTPRTTPTAPRSFTATLNGRTSAALAWSPPASDGGSPLTGYEVRYSTSGGTPTVIPLAADTTAVTLSALAADSAYTISVAAVNAVGAGPLATSALTTLPVPVQPTAWSQTTDIEAGAVTTLTALDVGTMRIVGGDGYVFVGPAYLKKVNLTNGAVTTVAGNGSVYCSDNANPMQASVRSVGAMASDGVDLYFVDDCGYGDALRRMSLSTGAISTVLTAPQGVAFRDVTVGPGGGLYMSTYSSTASQVVVVDPAAKTSRVLATMPVNSSGAPPVDVRLAADSRYLWALNTTCYGYSGCLLMVRIDPTSGGMSTQAYDMPGGLKAGFQVSQGGRLVSAGDFLYIGQNFRVYRFRKSDGIVTGVAGSSRGDLDGVGAQAWLGRVVGIDTDGTNLWVSEDTGHIRKISSTTPLTATQQSRLSMTTSIAPAVMDVLAGTTTAAVVDGTGTGASFSGISSMHVADDGYAYVVDGDMVLRRVTLSTGQVETIAGTTTIGNDDNATALQAQLGTTPSLTSDGTFLYWVQVSGNDNRIRRMSLSTGSVSTVAIRDSSPSSLQFAAVAVGPDNALYVATGTGIDRIDTITGASTTVATFPATSGYAYAYRLTADNTGVWAISNRCTGPNNTNCGSILKLDTTTGDLTQLPGSVHATQYPRYHERSFTSAGAYLYVATEYRQRDFSSRIAVVRVRKSDGQRVVIADMAHSWVTGIVASGDKLYMATATPTARVFRLTQAPPTGPVDPFEHVGGYNPAQSNDCSACAGDPIDLASGDFFESTTDISVPGRGVPLAFTRTYDTRRAAIDGRLGYGWTHAYNWALSVETSEALTNGQVTIRQDNGSQTVFTPDGIGGYTTPPRLLASLIKNADGSWTYTIRQGMTYRFNTSGRLTAITDLNGYTTTLAYDTSTRLATVTEPAGRTLTLGYDGFSRATTITDSTGRKVTYTYDNAGNLVTVTNLAGGAWQFEYDTAHRLTKVTDPRGHATVNTYDPATGKVTAQTNRRGKTMRFDYSPVAADGSHTTTVTHPAGNSDVYTYLNGRVLSKTAGAGTPEAETTTYTYDGATNAITSIRDNAGHTTTYTVDDRGNRLSLKDPLGRVTSWTYNAFNQPLTIKDPTGIVTTNTYDDRGNLLSTSRPRLDPDTGAVTDTVRTEYTYGDPAHPGDVTAVRDPNGNVTEYAYDAYGNRTKVTDATGRVTTTAYNTLGWVTSVVSPAGNAPGGDPTQHTTRYSDFTAAGQPKTVTDPLGHSSQLVYDNNGNTTKVTDAEGRVIDTTYNQENQPTLVTLNGAKTSGTSYDDNGNTDTTSDGLDHATGYDYDALDRATLITDPLGHTTQYQYDAAGNRTTVIDDTGRATTTGYDKAGQPTSVTDAENRTTDYRYDDLGRIETVTDAAGRITKTVYDTAGRRTHTLHSTSGALTVTGEWTYDLAGNVLTSRDGEGAETRYTRDEAGRVLTVEDPAHRVTSYTHDANGNQTTINRPGGITITNAYDPAGRLTGIDYPAGTPDVTYTYDDTGRRTTMTDGTGTTTYTYNPRGQLTGTTHTPASGTGRAGGSGAVTTVGYDYDAAGRQTGITYPGSRTITRTYDDADRLETVTDWANRTTSYTWNTNNTLKNTTLPNGLVTTYTYDDTNLTTHITTRPTATPEAPTVLDLGYEYDNTALLTQVTDLTQPTSPDVRGYTWDDRGRLDTVTGSTTAGAGDYTFDNANRLTTTGTGTFTVDQAGQLTTSTTTATPTTPATTSSYGYDQRGNRSSTITTPDTGAPGSGTATTRAYGYDAADRLTTYTTTATPNLTLTYSYDGDGLRATTTTSRDTETGPSTATEAYTWDASGDLPLLLQDATNTYLYGADTHPYAQVNSTTGEITYLHADAGGSTRATTDANGDVTATWDYDPYGNTTTHTGPDTTPFHYAGEYHDTTTDLHYLRARHYDPTTGQFLTRDPLEDISGSAYGYTNGNPLQYADPTGLLWQDLWAATKGVGLGIGDVVTGIQQSQNPVFLAQNLYGAYREGGIGLAVNQLNPVYHFLVNADRGWQLASQGCITEASRAFTNATFDAVSAAGVAAGGAASMGRAAGARAGGSAVDVAPPTKAPGTDLVRYDPAFASRNLLSQMGDGYATTPRGRTLSAHAADRIVNGGGGRRPTTVHDVDNILDSPTGIKYDPVRDSVKVTGGGKPYVVVSGSKSPQHVVTVMIP